MDSNLLKTASPITLWDEFLFTVNTTDEKQVLKAKTSLTDVSTIVRFIKIRANENNENALYIGTNNLTKESTGIVLYAGEAQEIAINDMSKVFIIGTLGEKLGVTYVIE